MAIKTVFFDIGKTLVDDKNWMPGAEKAIFDLRMAKVALGVLSNTAELDRDQLSERLPGNFDFDLFEPSLVLLSSETGCEKPGTGAFLLAIQHSGNSPWESMFVGESLIETVSAQRAGMFAARCLNKSDLAEIVQFVLNR